MTRGDKGKLFILFIPLFTRSLLSKIVCSLWFNNDAAPLIGPIASAYVTQYVTRLRKLASSVTVDVISLLRFLLLLLSFLQRFLLLVSLLLLALLRFIC